MDTTTQEVIEQAKKSIRDAYLLLMKAETMAVESGDERTGLSLHHASGDVAELYEKSMRHL